MNLLITLLQIIIPSAIVFATAYFLVKNFLDNESKKRMSEIKKTNQELITPVRLQAYERVVLFLERITPNSLVMRIHSSGMSARALHGELLKTIRLEFEHNVAQQVYISNKAWAEVKNSKEEIIKLINVCSTKVDGVATGAQLAEKIIEVSSQIPKLPTQIAIENLKKEIALAF